MDEFKTLEESIKQAKDKEALISVYRELVTRFPFLYGYWLKAIQVSDDPGSTWEEALSKCQSLELWVEYLKSPYGSSVAAAKKAVDIFGCHFQGHHVYDIYLSRIGPAERKEVVREVLEIPLYHHANYMKLAQQLDADKQDYFKSLSLNVTKSIKEIWQFESHIKRFYFHPQELEKSELDAWKSYLSYMEKTGSHKQIKTLYRRCITATALYPEFWLLYIRYLLRSSEESDKNELLNIFKLAMHHVPQNTMIRETYALKLELEGQFEEARNLLTQCSIDSLVAFDIRNNIELMQIQNAVYEIEYIAQTKSLHRVNHIKQSPPVIEELFKSEKIDPVILMPLYSEGLCPDLVQYTHRLKSAGNIREFLIVDSQLG